MDFKQMVQNFNPKDLKQYKWIADIIVLIGGVNYLLLGIGINLLGGFLGHIIAIIIGLAACMVVYFTYGEKLLGKGGGPNV